MSKITVQEVGLALEQIAPAALAESWDNSGLQVGDPQKPVQNILLALDFDRLVLSEAQAKNCQLIITHHPFLFQGLKKIDFSSYSGGLIRDLALSGISLLAAHTNLDSVQGGVNDRLAELLGLEQVELLNEASAEKLQKLVVFVPETHLETVQQALWQAGAGQIGDYQQCSFRGQGTGTFLPLEKAQPFIGEKGELAQVSEFRLEMIVPERKIRTVIKALLAAHPYEEPAYEYFPIQPANRGSGLGRIGVLPQSLSLGDLLEQVRQKWGIAHLRYGGAKELSITKVALCGGSGSDLWKEARSKGADILITGDVKYHEARNMMESGLAFIDAGHYASEITILPFLRQALAQALPEVNLYLSEVEGDPFQFWG